MLTKPICAGVFITRRCNLRCRYCNIPKKGIEDMSRDAWIKAFKIMNEIGIKKVNILGGEPTMFSSIEEIIDYILNKTNMDCSMITNSLDSKQTVLKLIDIGLKNISVSIDSIDIENSISPIKAKRGLELLNLLKEKSLLKGLNFKVYTVLNTNNIDTVEHLVKYMTNLGVSVYFLPFHWSQDDVYEHRKSNNQLGFITEDSICHLKQVLVRLIDMKEKGYLISNSMKYFEDIPKYIKNLNWHCTSLSELRVDFNGQLMCCCDKKGSVYDSYSIFDLEDNKKLENFLNQRAKDLRSCKGCLWPSSYEAELLKHTLNEDNE